MNVNFKIAQSVNRKKAVEQGFYDGRFKSKVIPDKKKSVHLKLRKQKPNENS